MRALLQMIPFRNVAKDALDILWCCMEESWERMVTRVGHIDQFGRKKKQIIGVGT